MKAFAFALGLLAVCSARLVGKNHLKDAKDPKESLNEIFAGFWEQGGISAPVHEIDCFDMPTANLTMIFIGEFLKNIAMNDVITLRTTLKNFNDNFPVETTYCMGNLTETDDLKDAYNVSTIPYPVLKSKVVAYIILHITTLSKQANTAYFYWFQGMYKTLGNYFGDVAKLIIGGVISSQPLGDNLDDLQNLLNGLFEQAGLADPTTIVKCFDNRSAKSTLDFFLDVIQDLATDNYVALVREYQIYKDSLPQDTRDCLMINQEVRDITAAYGFDKESPKSLLQKYVLFNVKHHALLINETKQIQNDASEGNWHDAGKVTGQLIQGILSGQFYEYLLA
jgi:hypothetical protein